MKILDVLEKCLVDSPNVLDFIYYLSEKCNVVLVGGFVRNFLIGLNLKSDIDIEIYNISLSEVEVELKNRGIEYCNTGRSFGVIKLKGVNVDISSPRKEIKKSAGHLGFEVLFDPNMDFFQAFERRDFTCNSIGYCIKTDQYIDYFSGIDHINKRILIPTSVRFFSEDPLRFFRAARFASKINFSVSDSFYELLYDNFDVELSCERIAAEFSQVLCGDNAFKGVLVLREISKRCIVSSSFFRTFRKFIDNILLYDRDYFNKLCYLEKVILIIFNSSDFDVKQFCFNIRTFFKFNVNIFYSVDDVSNYFAIRKCKVRNIFVAINILLTYKETSDIKLCALSFYLLLDVKSDMEIFILVAKIVPSGIDISALNNLVNIIQTKMKQLFDKENSDHANADPKNVYREFLESQF